MSKNKLKLNNIELLIVSSKNAQNKIQNNKNIQIGSSTISASTNVRNLGIYLDSTLSVENHIKKIRQSVYNVLPNQESKQHKKTPKYTAEILMHAFVTSRLDNGNALPNGISEQQLKKT